MMITPDKQDGWRLIAAIGLAATLLVLVRPADARELHRHHRKSAPPPSSLKMVDPDARLPIPYAYSFYPHEIEGGVSGNLPFNNQIRKFRDPLNANGAGG